MTRGSGTSTGWAEIAWRPLAETSYDVCVEEAGPLRAVIRCEGAFEADLPMHHLRGVSAVSFRDAHLRVCRPFRVTGSAHRGRGVQSERDGSGGNRAARAGLAVRLRELQGCRQPGDSRVWRTPANRCCSPSGSTITFAWSGVRAGARERLPKGTAPRAGSPAKTPGSALGVGPAPYAGGISESAGRLGRPATASTCTAGRIPTGNALSLKRYSEAVAWDEGEGVLRGWHRYVQDDRVLCLFLPGIGKRRRARSFERMARFAARIGGSGVDGGRRSDGRVSTP